jgi:hypothetical protein
MKSVKKLWLRIAALNYGLCATAKPTVRLTYNGKTRNWKVKNVKLNL